MLLLPLYNIDYLLNHIKSQNPVPTDQPWVSSLQFWRWVPQWYPLRLKVSAKVWAFEPSIAMSKSHNPLSVLFQTKWCAAALWSWATTAEKFEVHLSGSGCSLQVYWLEPKKEIHEEALFLLFEVYLNTHPISSYPRCLTASSCFFLTWKILQIKTRTEQRQIHDTYLKFTFT